MLFLTPSATASPQATTPDRSTTDISNYCGLLGASAGAFASNPDIRHFDVELTSAYISDRTAFDFSETKSRMSDIARNASLLTLTPAEFAGHTYFWCVYDLLGAEPGTKDVFDIEKNSIKLFQTMFKPEDE